MVDVVEDLADERIVRDRRQVRGAQYEYGHERQRRGKARERGPAAAAAATGTVGGKRHDLVGVAAGARLLQHHAAPERVVLHAPEVAAGPVDVRDPGGGRGPDLR